MDFAMDALASGWRFKCLTIIAAFGISSLPVMRILDSIALSQSYPTIIITVQVSEFTCCALNHGPLSMGWSCGLFNRASRRRTELLRILTDAFANNA